MSQKPRGRVRRDPDVRRDQIIEEAIRIVGERGYYGFTVQELAQRCGLSNAGLLYHFGSKDQILIDMLDEFERRETAVVGPLVALAEQERARGDGTGAALAHLLATMVVRASTHPEVGRLYMVLKAEAVDPSHPAHTSFRARQAATLGLFADLLAPHASDPWSTARQLLALMDGLSHQWISEDEAFDIQAEWARAVSAILPRLPPPKVSEGPGPAASPGAHPGGADT